MLAVERRLQILDRVARDQTIEVGKLAVEFGVSEMTIRRDIHRLERDGFLRRTYGGATAHAVRSVELGFNARSLRNAQEKRLIAVEAAKLMEGLRVVFVGPGTTAEQFARFLVSRPDLTVITPSLPIASLLGTRAIRTISVGGTVRPNELDNVGPLAIDVVRRYHTEAAVLGATGLSARYGLTESDDGQAEVTRAAIEQAAQIIVLADGSKFGVVAMASIAAAASLATIVTDVSAPADEVAEFERLGVRVVRAQLKTASVPASESG
jgi:DeoR/GlpR family transcriptional regulator of sugar metabolism